MSNTTANATHTEISNLITARAVHGDDAAFSYRNAPQAPVASTTIEYVTSGRARYRIATLTDGTRWLAVRHRGTYLPVFSVARLALAA